MSDPFSVLANVPSATECTWRPFPTYIKQYYNNKQGGYEIGDGSEYQMFQKLVEWVPMQWHTTYDPVTSPGGDGTFQAAYSGPINVTFKTRFKNDGTGVEFRLRVNDNVIHTYRTPLVQNGGFVDSLMQHSFDIVENDIIKITAQAYINPSSSIVQDTDDYGNPNTIITFTK